jgi:hypothetical protein
MYNLSGMFGFLLVPSDGLARIQGFPPHFLYLCGFYPVILSIIVIFEIDRSESSMKIKTVVYRGSTLAPFPVKTNLS